MKRFLSLLFAVVFSCLSVPASAEDPVRISTHYSLFIDSNYATSAKGDHYYDFDTLCLDIYILEGNKTAFLIESKTYSGLFLTSGSQKYHIMERPDGSLLFSMDNGAYFYGYFDENGSDLWVTYYDAQVRLKPVASFSIFNDRR